MVEFQPKLRNVSSDSTLVSTEKDCVFAHECVCILLRQSIMLALNLLCSGGDRGSEPPGSGSLLNE